MFRAVLYRMVVVVCLALLTAFAVACGDSDESADAGSGEKSAYPDSQFPPSTFGDLEGQVVWYDTNGGQATAARESTIFKHFTELTGVPVTSDYNKDTTKLIAGLEAGQAPWNAIDFPAVGAYIHARDQGLLEPLDKSIIPVDRMEDGAYDEYGIYTARYGIVLAWNTDKLPESGPQPTSLKDLFNTEDFPGKRCMMNYPEFGGTLEAALLADGVPREELYPLDVDRAFRKLDTIKDDIVWWNSGAESVQYLINGECDIGVTWSGRVFDEVRKNDAPLKMTWGDSVYTQTVYGIPKGAQNLKAAQAMLAMWILDEKGQQEFVSKFPYPTPIKGMSYSEEIAQWLPVGENLETAVEEDGEYYAKNLDELSERFIAWQGS
jgi:putative spermidine/putrescine transport system substrate-binding protein